MPMFNLAKTFFTPLAAGRTLINMGVRSMSSITNDFLRNFTRELKQKPLIFQKTEINENGIRYIASYGDVPISIRVNADFPAVPLFTVCAKLPTAQNKKTLKALFMFDDVDQLPHNWQVPRHQPEPSVNFSSK